MDADPGLRHLSTQGCADLPWPACLGPLPGVQDYHERLGLMVLKAR